ncbi:MAG: type IX secretion system protein PorQ [Crocinitomicaceae bacterium]
MKTLLGLFFLLLTVGSWAQTGGTTSFSFLDLAYNARTLALGNDFISVKDQDLSLGVSNPSLINAKMNKRASTNQALLPGGINYGMINYGRTLKNDFVGVAHLRYVDYGKMIGRDIYGNESGVFKPMDFVLGASVAKPFSPKLSIGASLNFIFSQLSSYSSIGASLDFAGNYYNEDKEFLATVLVKNAGYQFKGFTPGKHEPLPVELQMAFSKKLKHAPFRFSLLAHHLNKWDLSYVDPNAKPTIDALTGDSIPVPTANFIEKTARHLTYQLEVLISENLHVRTAFDFQKRQEMKLFDRPGVSGFSFGAGFYFKRFSVDYGFGVVSRAGYQHMLSLSTNLGQWRK